MTESDYISIFENGALCFKYDEVDVVASFDSSDKRNIQAVLRKNSFVKIEKKGIYDRRVDLSPFNVETIFSNCLVIDDHIFEVSRYSEKYNLTIKLQVVKNNYITIECNVLEARLSSRDKVFNKFKFLMNTPDNSWMYLINKNWEKKIEGDKGICISFKCNGYILEGEIDSSVSLENNDYKLVSDVIEEQLFIVQTGYSFFLSRRIEVLEERKWNDNKNVFAVYRGAKEKIIMPTKYSAFRGNANLWGNFFDCLISSGKNKEAPRR